MEVQYEEMDIDTPIRMGLSKNELTLTASINPYAEYRDSQLVTRAVSCLYQLNYSNGFIQS